MQFLTDLGQHHKDLLPRHAQNPTEYLQRERFQSLQELSDVTQADILHVRIFGP